MRSLRQLLRRRSQSANAEGTQQRRAEKRSTPPRAQKRRLMAQSLEQRQLLAADIGINPAHNYWNGNDVNQDLQISPADALNVINYLGAMQAGAQGEMTEDSFAGRKVDVNGDGQVTPSDALGVINAIARGEGMTPLAEYFITARDNADNELTANGSGAIEVGVGIDNAFFLEVSYADLRGFGDDLGAFSIFPDIGVSTGGLLQPVLRETQQIIIGEEIRATGSGDLTIGSEGTSDTVVVTLGQIQGGFSAALSAALVQFGYSVNDFTITEPQALKGENGQSLGFQIQYTSDAARNADLPDLTFNPNFDNAVPVTFREFAPFEADGTTPNSDAVRFNLDTNSRTLTSGGEFYNQLNRGTFDLATGFTDIGGVGGAFPNGVREVNGGVLVEPFDAFRIEVFLNQDVASLTVDVNPGEGVDPLTLYGSNEVVPPDLITIGDGASLVLTTGDVVVNQPPALATSPLTATFTEDDADGAVNLLLDATDPESQTLSVVSSSFAIVSGDASGTTLNGNNLSVTPSSYNSLAVSETETVVATYNITDGTNNVAQTLTLTITGVNDAPVVSAAITQTATEDTAAFNVDLLQNASDVDTSDVLDVTGIALASGDDAGVTIDDTNNQLSVNPAAYSALNAGESAVIVYNFNVVDGNGGSVPSTATITINGATPNQPPVVSGPVTVSLSEDDSASTLDLLTNASDPNSDTLAIDTLTSTSGDTSGITENATSLSIDPSAYNALPAGGSEIIVYTYNVNDGRGGSVAQSATVTIGGANDAPTVGNAVTGAFTEDGTAGSVDLLTGASDPDTGATLSVANLVRVSGDDSGFSQNGNSIDVDPSGYDSLAAGATEQVVYTYDVTDGTASVAQTATITITGINDAPTVGNAITATVSEDDASSSLSLLTGAADADTGDTLSISNFAIASGDDSGLTQSGTSLSIDPSAYNSLPAGSNEVITATFNVTDGNGGSTAQTATITITGANDAPVVSAVISETFNEDQATQTVDLLANASDADTGSTLSVSVNSVTGDQTGVSLSEGIVTVDPSAYGSLNSGQSETIVFTYTVTDGTASTSETTATIVIEGRDEGFPVVSAPITVQFDEDDASANVDLLANATDPDGDTLSIANATIASGDASGVTIDSANNRLVINPSAYNGLNTGQSAVIVVNYDVTDGTNSTATTATVTIIGEDEPLISGSTISGALWIDSVDNIQAVLAGAAPERDGVQQSDEDALGGITVRLLQVTGTGEQEVARVLTTNTGSYAFTDVDPGTYFVEYELAESIQYTGSNRGQVVIGDAGGVSASGPTLGAVGMTGTLSRLDLLARNYVASGIVNTVENPGGLAGGTVELTSDGNQAMFVAGDGFDSISYAELVINESRDAALLSIIDTDGVVRTARLSAGEFVTTSDGTGVRFFGALSDFDFVETDADLIRSEFTNYRNAIDQVLAAGL